MPSQISLAEKAYRALTDDILRCTLVPGEFVTEADLASRYRMSKTPVREALNLLSQEGFIQSVPRRGTLVQPIELRDIQQTYLLRGLLEPPAASLAAERATPAEVERIRALLSAMTSDGADGVPPAVLRSNQLRAHREFHVAIAEASGIPRLRRMINSLQEEVERFMNANRRLGSKLTFGDMDQQLVDAIALGDEAKAREVALQSVDVSRRSLIEAFLDVS
jgi:DNA-binding GntR family transcriptional regulator